MQEVTPKTNKTDIRILETKIDTILTLTVVEFLGFIGIIIALITNYA